MNGQRLGSAMRAIRRHRRLRQADVAALAGVSQSVVTRLERGHVDGLTVRMLERVCGALDVRVNIYPRWRGGDIDRLLSAGHAQMHEAIARWFRRRWPRWTTAPEVSFAFWGEQGVIDVLCWHAESRTLLVVELKTELVDLNEMVGTLDRKRRLAAKVARERGWDPRTIGVWLVIASGSTNRRHVADHTAFLRSAYPADARAIRRWLAAPHGPIAAMSLESFGLERRRMAVPKRIRRTAAPS